MASAKAASAEEPEHKPGAEDSVEAVATHDEGQATDAADPEAQQELRNVCISMQKSRLQAKRLENFSYEPMSLPPSRVSRYHRFVYFASY